MQMAFIGLGGVVETAWLPAIASFSQVSGEILGYDNDPRRQIGGILQATDLGTLLSRPLGLLAITTSSLSHLPVLEAALPHPCGHIVIEKPVVATRPQLARLERALDTITDRARVLAFDHWMGRTGIARLLNGQLGDEWQGPIRPVLTSGIDQIASIHGFLEEPCGTNQRGEPVALNFATGEPDPRELRHPDGVIMDIGTHVLAMMRENLALLGDEGELSIDTFAAWDRLGNPISRGDFITAEGHATLSGRSGGIPFTLELNKYAGVRGGRKGMTCLMNNGDTLHLDRVGSDEVLTLESRGRRSQWRRPGALYATCLWDLLFAPDSLRVCQPEQFRPITRRRMAEVNALLDVHDRLRGSESL